LAHRRADVRELNEAIRAARQGRGELTDERVYRTTEGERAFAPGDRILFRENNRDLGVKNGMLGTVERTHGVGAADGDRLGVRLDSAAGPGQGRAVSVSMADYAAVDHGYATTIHKAQGATVDRAYVLASGTMDRHLTYVAMTRHRDDVQLYAGRDEFRDVEALSARLSRSQAKETTLDYDRAAYAERRGIELSSEIIVPRDADRQAEPPAQTRSMFDGLKLSTGRGAFEGVRLPARERAPEPARQADGLSQAVDRYARAWTDAVRMQAQDLPILEHQKRALRDAGAALDVARPGATQDLITAMEHNPATSRAMTEMQGRDRAAQLVAGIAHEERVRQDPNLKAERLVKTWKGLEAQHERLSGYGQAEARGRVEDRMKAVAGALKRDPQLESLMRSRSKELGIDPGSRLDRVMRERDIERAISLGIGRGRDLGLSI
jgi:hypothetical protein